MESKNIEFSLDVKKNAALLESIIFLETDPVDIKKMAKISFLSVEDIQLALEYIASDEFSKYRGTEIIKFGEGYILMPKDEFWDILKEKYGKKNDERISKAALETLSIIAYSQPITKGEIEKIRGVSVDNIVKTLLEKDLITEKGKKDVLGKPTLYGTTIKFLKVFKLKSISELPKLDDIETKRFELN